MTKRSSASTDRWCEQSKIDLEHRYQFLVESVEDYAIFMLDTSGCVQTWNPGGQRIKGYASAEIIGRHFSVFYTDDDIAVGKPQALLEAALARVHVEDEGLRVRKDGSTFWANVVITAVTGPEGELLGFAKVTRDMTERRRLEELERLHARAAVMEQARESERKRIARELHDDLGQRLSALKMALAVHQTQIWQQGAEISDQIDAMTESLRRIAADLRPPCLDDLGLTAALEWLADSFQRRYGIKVRLAVHGEPEGLNELTVLSLYRIVQEALSNVARHSGASEVSIDLSKDDRFCRLRMSDNGVGLPLGEKLRSDAFGLIGMRERAAQIGGDLQISGRPGNGVHLNLLIPVQGLKGAAR
ncbi:PAS domain S-box protein [Caballeronia sp. RCC_10]|uniref:PAS domain-containing sensor histidine kinase n=1 Tax=Caballeronia sp. RCC_10 TaxID=3239227 RepID=UPI0035238CE2